MRQRLMELKASLKAKPKSVPKLTFLQSQTLRQLAAFVRHDEAFYREPMVPAWGYSLDRIAINGDNAIRSRVLAQLEAKGLVLRQDGECFRANTTETLRRRCISVVLTCEGRRVADHLEAAEKAANLNKFFERAKNLQKHS